MSDMNPLIASSCFPIIGCMLIASCDLIDPDAQISLPSAVGGSLAPVGVSRVRSSEAMETADGAYRVGDYVEVAQPETPLYPQHPSGGRRPLQLLGQGVVLNVLGLDGDYMHVQNENGDEGYVSTMTVVPQGLLMADLPLTESDVAIGGE